MKYPLSALVFSLSIGLVACDSSTPPAQQQQTNAQPTPAPVAMDAEPAPPSVCYSLKQGEDMTGVQLQQEGNSVFGYYAWEPHEKDGAHGILNGEVTDGLIKASYTYMLEGSVQTEEVYFRLENDKLLQGEGELTEENGILVVKDPSKLTFNKVLQKTDCAQLQDILERNEAIAAEITEQQANEEGAIDIAMLAENVIGDWQSSQDPKAQLVITESDYSERYDGKVKATFPYQLLDTCPASCGKELPDTPCLSISGQDQVCYVIVLADGENLELSQVNGTGNTNQYQRLPAP